MTRSQKTSSSFSENVSICLFLFSEHFSSVLVLRGRTTEDVRTTGRSRYGGFGLDRLHRFFERRVCLKPTNSD
jgi:hypothetical protein